MKNSKSMRAAIWAILGGLLLTALAADYPEWWSERGVVDDALQPQDHHPVNQGQVKWMAVQAAAEFQDKLPSPPNSPIDRMSDSFPSENNHRPANLGMLKNTAQPFYDRLIKAGYADPGPAAKPKTSPSPIRASSKTCSASTSTRSPQPRRAPGSRPTAQAATTGKRFSPRPKGILPAP